MLHTEHKLSESPILEAVGGLGQETQHELQHSGEPHFKKVPSSRQPLKPSTPAPRRPTLQLRAISGPAHLVTRTTELLAPTAYNFEGLSALSGFRVFRVCGSTRARAGKNDP